MEMFTDNQLREALGRSPRPLSGLDVVYLMESDWEIIRAAAESTLPKEPETKEIDLWYLHGWNPESSLPSIDVFFHRHSAEAEAATWRTHRPILTCVHVTGPHKMKVPA